MAEDITIEFEDDDDDEPIINQPTPSSQTNPQSNVNPTTPPFDPMGRSKENQRAVDKDIKQREKERRERIAEQRKQAREATRDREQARREQAKELKAASQDNITQARSDAISSRVQSYSLASAFGFAGYPIASAVDDMFIRPNEEQRVEKQRQYQKELAAYNAATKQDEIDRQRELDRRIKDQPVDATVIGPDGKPQKVQGPPKPPIKPPDLPPRVAPEIPDAEGAAGLNLAKFSPALAAVTASILIAKSINKAVDNIAQSATSVSTNIINGNTTETLKSGVSTAQSIVDPLGVQIPLNVAVQGFNSLLDVNQSILDSIQNGLGIAPQTIGATIERELLMLNKQIEIAARLDSINSDIVRANTELDLAFQDFREVLIENFGPTIVSLLKNIAKFVEINGNAVTLATNGLPLLIGALPGGIGTMVQLLQSISDNTNKQSQDLDQSDIFNQINQFFIPLDNTDPRFPGGFKNNPTKQF